MLITSLWHFLVVDGWLHRPTIRQRWGNRIKKLAVFVGEEQLPYRDIVSSVSTVGFSVEPAGAISVEPNADIEQPNLPNQLGYDRRYMALKQGGKYQRRPLVL